MKSYDREILNDLRYCYRSKLNVSMSRHDLKTAILSSEVELLEKLIKQIKKTYNKIPNHMKINFNDLVDYQPLCSCYGCIVPCLELANKENCFQQKVTKKMINNFF